MKLLELLKDQTIREFIKYTVCHPVKVFSSKGNYYDEYWKSNLIDVSAEEVKNTQIQSLCLFAIRNEDNANTIKARNKVWLAGRYQEIDFENIDWEMQFEDSEDVAAYHRFLWMYRVVFENVNKCDKQCLLDYVKGAIYSWIEKVEKCSPKELHSEVWQTYTVSERIFNWLNCLAILSDKPFSDDIIIESVVRQANYIQNHLEYYGEWFTGNHLTNDARGLYAVGSILGLDAFKSLGKMLIKHEYERVVYEPGYLREGSTHYQLLFTKWYADLYWISLEFKDSEFSAWIKPRLMNLVKASETFLYLDNGEFDMPFWGDISPDQPPKWIIGTTQVARFLLNMPLYEVELKQPGYHSLFQPIWILEKTETIEYKNVPIEKNCEWGRLDNENFVVHTRVFSNIFPNSAPGHFHNDTGSFTLVYKGQKVIVDNGRMNYLQKGFGLYQKDRFGHNQVIIDEFTPYIVMRRFFRKNFLEYLCDKKPSINQTKDNVCTKYYNFQSKNGFEYCERIISVSENEVKIQDTIVGEGEHELELILHIHPSYYLKKLNNKVEMANENAKGTITYSSSNGLIELVNEEKYDSYSEQYGDNGRCNVVKYNEKVVLPYTLITRITMGEL